MPKLRYFSVPLIGAEGLGLDWLPSSAALVFASSTGSPLSHSNFVTASGFLPLTAAGLAGVHLHDLRHTGNQLTANAGANPKELMARMGHDKRSLSHLAREWHETAVRLPGLVNDLRPDRDSNAGPTA